MPFDTYKRNKRKHRVHTDVTIIEDGDRLFDVDEALTPLHNPDTPYVMIHIEDLIASYPDDLEATDICTWDIVIGNETGDLVCSGSVTGGHQYPSYVLFRLE